MAPGVGRRVRATQQTGNVLSQAGTNIPGTKKKGGRTRATNQKLHDFLKNGGQKPRIDFLPDLKRPIGNCATAWVTELGITARKCIPLRCHTWKDVNDKIMENVYKRITEYFDVDLSNPHVVDSVISHIQTAFRNYRAELHTYYKGLPSDVDKTQHPRDDVLQHDWAMLCAFWEGNEKFQGRSVANKRSRERVRILHRGGSRSFGRCLIEKEDPVTKKPDFLTFYKDMHYSTKKGWIAPAAEQNYEQMVEMANQPTEGESTPKTTEEIRSAVLGERPGYTPGLGYGVVPKTRGVRVATTAAVTAATFGQMEELRNRAESAENELHQMKEQHLQMKEQQTAQQQQLDLIMTQMQKSTGPWMNMLMETINS